MEAAAAAVIRPATKNHTSRSPIPARTSGRCYALCRRRSDQQSSSGMMASPHHRSEHAAATLITCIVPRRLHLPLRGNLPFASLCLGTPVKGSALSNRSMLSKISTARRLLRLQQPQKGRRARLHRCHCDAHSGSGARPRIRNTRPKQRRRLEHNDHGAFRVGPVRLQYPMGNCLSPCQIRLDAHHQQGRQHCV